MLVASHLSVKENAYYRVSISFIFIFTSMNQVQFQVKLMPANCMLRRSMNVELFNLEIAHFIIVV